ncbi:MAG: 4Fe-4S binding protein [Candidatus Solibacter usitatus]|nr:4Fe-4S binding protein [Candidatus Solibacter usitatus]
MLIRRTAEDISQPLRRTVQVAFLLLNLWIGFQFYQFVRQFETGVWRGWQRPAGVEGWLPIAGMMNSKVLLLTGYAPEVHPAAMVLFLVFVTSSLLLRKSFCGWLCPVGTLSEYLWSLGRETFRRTWTLPKWLDIPLRGLKYLLLGFFLYAVVSMTVTDIEGFLRSPYGLIADVRMLNFFRALSVTAAIIIGLLTIGSVFIANFWCRYLCPYGALMGLAALLSPLRIRRNKERCIDCAKCAKVCPAQLPVDRLTQIRSAECMACMSCIAVCPAEGALAMKLPGRKSRIVRPEWIAAAIAILLVASVTTAKWTGHWETPLPAHVYQRLVPLASETGHP